MGKQRCVPPLLPLPGEQGGVNIFLEKLRLLCQHHQLPPAPTWPTMTSGWSTLTGSWRCRILRHKIPQHLDHGERAACGEPCPTLSPGQPRQACSARSLLPARVSLPPISPPSRSLFPDALSTLLSSSACLGSGTPSFAWPLSCLETPGCFPQVKNLVVSLGPREGLVLRCALWGTWCRVPSWGTGREG